MAKKRVVPFLRYFNSSRMLLIFEMDTVIVTIVSFMVTYFTLSHAAAKISITMFTSLFVAIAFSVTFSKVKETASRGFLQHWTYINVTPIFEILYKKNHYDEYDSIDVVDYEPSPEDTFFAD